MSCETVDPAFRKLRLNQYAENSYTKHGKHLLSARLASVLVTIARVFELGASLEIFADERVRFATHDT